MNVDSAAYNKKIPSILFCQLPGQPGCVPCVQRKLGAWPPVNRGKEGKPVTVCSMVVCSNTRPTLIKGMDFIKPDPFR